MTAQVHTRRWLGPASLSVVVHALIAGSFVLGAAEAPKEDSQPEEEAVWFELDFAPAPPELFDPSGAPIAVTLSDGPSGDPITEAGIALDAGVSDAGLMDAGGADAGVPDAGVPDAGVPDASLPDAAPVVASNQAPPPDAGSAAATDGDGGLRAGIQDGGPDSGDAGLVAVADAGGQGDAGTDEPPKRSGKPFPAVAALDFTRMVPKGDRVSVYLRLARLRKTPWARQAEAIVRPMPDYRTIVGKKGKLVDSFDDIMMTSADPNDVAATSLAGRTRMKPAQLRKFLTQPGAPVKWKPAVGGARGDRSGRIAKHDKRVFLTPYRGWVVLATPKNLGALVRDGGTLDGVAPAAAIPGWLAQLHALTQLGDDEKGPVAIVTIQNLPQKLPKKLREQEMVPDLVKLPLPSRAALSLEPAPGGFLLRAVLHFKNPKQAKSFATLGMRIKEDISSGFLSRRLLEQANALNFVKGLNLRAGGNRIALTTSISASDGRAMMTAAANWTRSYYAK